MADNGRANAPSAAGAIVDALIEEGIEYVFRMTGDTVLPILDAIYHRRNRIKYITARYVGSHYGETDLVKLAEAHGARGERIEEPDRLAGALRRAAEADVTSVIDVRIDGWEDHYRAAEWAGFHKF